MIGFLFDLDGTLIEMKLDFDVIRREMGVPDSYPSVLEYIRDSEEPGRMYAILRSHEARAAASARPRDGAKEFLAYLKNRGMPRGIVTRNSRQSAEIVVDRLDFDVGVIVGRDDVQPKPSPEPVLLAARQLGVPLDSLVMVGDHRYDIECGKNAGVRTIFLRGTHPSPGTADFEVNSLMELIPLVEQGLLD